ncbi:hypothetical protein F3087_04790 [Nocardia colli]|uniref:Tyrosine-type recombinase/integrase n=1 Tax=Nocardia colli TaxID=2545717 RepID=A0A5N0EMF7_9NOCA|nr:hypothetical protein [Nocardia colli]KAA8890587.1 hypothetical protein F3087_04790 [Nocardia colli]
MQDKGNSGKTIANKHGFFASAMAAAARMRPKPLIAYNPCEGMRLPRHDSAEMVFFELAEYELFLSAMPQRWHAQTEFSLASMARPSEVGALTLGDVNRGTGAVRINKAFKYAGTRRRLGPPKTKRGVRTVNVPFETLDLLDLDRPHDALLFQTRRGTPIRPAYFYQEAFLSALRELVEIDDQGHIVVDRLVVSGRVRTRCGITGSVGGCWVVCRCSWCPAMPGTTPTTRPTNGMGISTAPPVLLRRKSLP